MNEFRLYISGHNQQTDKSINSLKKYLDMKFDGNYSLDVINLLMVPEQAAVDNVIVTPTMIKVNPKPEKKLIGDIRAIQKFMEILLTGDSP